MSYLLWSGKLQGWLSTSSTYVSDIAQAKHFTRDEALAMARRHKTQAGYSLLPVALADMEAI